MNSPYLMLATLNTEWLAWTLKTPLKVYLYDQEVVGEGIHEPSIPLNSVNSRTTGRGEGEKQERESRKIEGRIRERKWEEPLLVFFF